ncbi:rhomboid family protein [Desulfoferrobacter suflitae]|uniref:rhomboid family protein n=1 Tax=Desulfoferrobacter suflitae TaxID=2865782 RepID=UPI002164573E|nr:rhomboid family intramembrane serine protease [Desulfoferrobacter suflitae]MCK8600347.1 rhomboid family intramembrane serine protease [Desulfoferrobacter suflitae]
MTVNRNSILCPNCRRLISADEPRCPHCGLARPGSWWKNSLLVRGFNNPEQLIKNIIYLNILMFVLSLVLVPRFGSLALNPFALLSPDNRSLLLLGATGTLPIDRLHRWWTLLSANYLHAGLLHILFNMFALYQIGPLVIREYGNYRFFIIYTLSGVFGYWLSYLAGVTFTIGASAAICGLIGATLYYGRSRGGEYGRTLFGQVGGWAVGIFVFGLLVPGINNWGHGGGLLAGALLGFLLGYNERTPEAYVHKLAAGVFALTTLGVLAWAAGAVLFAG